MSQLFKPLSTGVAAPVAPCGHEGYGCEVALLCLLVTQILHHPNVLIFHPSSMTDLLMDI